MFTIQEDTPAMARLIPTGQTWLVVSNDEHRCLRLDERRRLQRRSLCEYHLAGEHRYLLPASEALSWLSAIQARGDGEGRGRR